MLKIIFIRCSSELSLNSRDRMELLPSNFFSRPQLNGFYFARQTNAFTEIHVFVYEGLLSLFPCLKILIERI